MYENRLAQLRPLLDEKSLIRLRNTAAQAQSLENRWTGEVSKAFEKVEYSIFQRLEETGELDLSMVSFLPLYAEHSLNAMWLGYMTAYTREQTQAPPFGEAEHAKLARSPRLPRSLADLMELWDGYRKNGTIPRRQQIMADRVGKAYIRKIRSIWDRYSEDWRKGDTFTRDAIKEAIVRQGRTTEARAKQIVQTETTHYYNQARRQVYDSSPDVTHYLFVAIRDAATTEWCRTRQGIVYKKGSAYLEKETPPIHWNCRSEILPLSPENPAHLRLIQNESLWRENNRPKRLPSEWNKRVA